MFKALFAAACTLLKKSCRCAHEQCEHTSTSSPHYYILENPHECHAVIPLHELYPPTAHMQLKMLTTQGRVAIARHLADATIGCFRHMYDEVLSRGDSQESFDSLVLCALAFPGVQRQIGQYTCSELQRLVDTPCLQLHPQGVCIEGDHNGEDLVAIHRDPEPTRECAQNFAACRESSEDRPHVPQSALAFL